MEAEAGRLAHQGLQLTLSSPGMPGLEVVRALHQTVISLRSALDSSREEVRRLKEDIGEFSGENYVKAVERLALENHILRRKILSRNDFSIDAATSPPPLALMIKHQTEPGTSTMDTVEDETVVDGPAATTPQEPEEEVTEKPQSELSPIPEVARESCGDDDYDADDNRESASGEEKIADDSGKSRNNSTIDYLDVPDKEMEDLSLKSASDGDNSAFTENQLLEAKPNDSENESEELDDIELIFTTEETCRDVELQEDLVSITENEPWQRNSGQPVLLKYTKSAEVCNGDKTSSQEEAMSSQSSSIDREESVDRFDENSNTRLNKIWSQCSVLVETDISKCGVLEETELSARHGARRNTLAAPPTAYRPIIHREALAAGRRKSSAPLRPVMDRNCGARRESGAQTEITAVPSQWKSESYLAHKVAHSFTTLPSKFALPAGMSGRLRVNDKTREARRVMLSDINFTSMVPELSRSADHLCHDPHVQSCYNARGCGLRTPEVMRRESLGSPAGYWPRCNTGTGPPSPCDCRIATDFYPSRYRGSLTSIPSPGWEGGPSRRHSWKATATSFDACRIPIATSTPRPTWSSMPSSPTHVHPPPPAAKTSKIIPKKTRSKVTFQDCPITRRSLPNLRADLDTSGESTESLIDESEDYLRRSFDSMLTISPAEYRNKQLATRKKTRRHSEPDIFRKFTSQQGVRLYEPKIPRDLKLDHFVKVISRERKVLEGRVRYVGPVPEREDIHVGVELEDENGSSDGTFHGRRFFFCEPYKAVFVPFKKVILARYT